MASSPPQNKRKQRDSGNDEGRKRLKVDENMLQDIIKMVRKNKNSRIELTPQVIVDIAQMAKDNIKQLRRNKKGKRAHYRIEARDIAEIAELVKENRKKIKKKIFHVKQIAGHRRWGYNEYVYDVKIGPANTSTLPAFLNSLREVFNYLINIMKYIASTPTDKARFYISKAPMRAFSTAILNVCDFNADLFFDVFERHMQSNAEVIINEGWQSTISIFIFPNNYVPRTIKRKKKNPKMYAYLMKKPNEFGRGRKKTATKHGRDVRHGVFQIVGVTNCCFAYALCVARSFLHNDENCKKLKLNPNTTLTTLYENEQIHDMYKRCGVARGKVRVADLHLFYERILAKENTELVVFSKTQNDTVVYDSRVNRDGHVLRVNENIIYLWLNDQHYDVILSPNTFLKLQGFCFKCMRHFQRAETVTNHVCRGMYTCPNCYSPNALCPNEGLNKKCPLCDVIFQNAACYTRHLQNRVFPVGRRHETPCQHMFFCSTCYKRVPRLVQINGKKRTKHKCDEMYCSHCQGIRKKTHECYMKTCRIHGDVQHPTLFFFDFETRKDDEGYMIPFYCVVQKVCVQCDEKPFEKIKEAFEPVPDEPHADASVQPVICCGYRQYVFEKNNACITADLVDFMYAQERNSVWVAHNGGRFDTIFLLRELLIERNVVPQTIMNGNKIMCMEIEERNLKILDSFLFMSMALSKFPEALGIQNIAKGFHPYHFTDLTYVGPMVGLEYFEPPAEGTPERTKFDKWYRVQCLKTYIFKEAIYYYCRLDVDILRQGCIIFARLIKNITGVFPFYDKTCHTIAGLALKIYRSNFLVKDTIGQIPAKGYGTQVKQSVIALYWLREVENELAESDYFLQSNLSVDGETQIMGRYVDGYCESTRTIYQFHGCFYHGCQQCYEGDEYNKVLNETYFTLRERTRRTEKMFKDGGYRVITMWECDYMRTNKLSKKTIDCLRHRDFFINVHLNPRDALFGGRTSPARLYFESTTEKAFYGDFTSLYPYVQKKNVYPTRHPTIVRGEMACDKIPIATVFGLIKCRIATPARLLFPVLPFRAGGKLTFPLCATCVSTHSDECTHDEDQRALWGTWTSIEVQKALQHGYKILNVYEIYHYETREKIFDTYVDTFMKLKQESSGVPKKCLDSSGNVDSVLLNRYIEEYREHEGVQLEAAKIAYNPGQRTVMKALLNSLWGKLAQNEDATVVSFVDSINELLTMVNDNTVEVTSMDFISDTIARTTHRKTNSLITLANRNVIIASFVTAYARLELFEVLHKLGDSVMYYDTDSVIYVENKAKGQTLATGEYLGDITDELSEKNCTEKWIEQFCTAGPKSYSFRTNLYMRTHEDGRQTLERDEIVHAGEIHCCTIPLQHPFMMTLCGPTQCGKTRYITDIIKNNDELIEPPVDKLLYLYTVYQPAYDDIQKHIRDNAATNALKTCEFVDCSGGILSLDEVRVKLGKATLLVLDDLMVVANANRTNLENLDNLASRDSHHTNTSVIFVCQSLAYGNGRLRNCRVNSQYHTVFNSLTDSRDMEMIASNKKIPLARMRKIVNDVGKTQHGYVLFDGSPRGYANSRIRTGIFPQDHTVVYDVGDEIN
ncbi:DNA polymerase [Paramuricea clavata]|uniref:DNA-directed DNA polymerase n=1 Tax=Paramuricea clavata TaxID=317549 RepID=A0A7D9HE57_PARCT|nr:DNA polymerase [Paramuricea clavata]